MRQNKDVRLFFALWPDSALRRQLHEVACAIPLQAGARRVPLGNLHLTLHFIGNVYFAQMDCLQAAARRVDACAFRLELDCQGFFSKPRVTWLGCREIPPALVDLHRELGARLHACDYQPERRPYHPHVTVARKSGPLGTAAGFDPLGWTVNEFALVEVQTVENGVHYRVVETYPLT